MTEPTDKGEKVYFAMFQCIESIARKYGRVLPDGRADGDWVVRNMDSLPQEDRDALDIVFKAVNEYNAEQYLELTTDRRGL